jgi:hypothetical protein
MRKRETVSQPDAPIPDRGTTELRGLIEETGKSHEGQLREPAAKVEKRIGRPPKDPADRLIGRTIRLTENDWALYYEIGGTKFLRAILRAKR